MFSVIAYASCMLIPKRANHLIKETGVGAAPVKVFLVLCKPSPFFILFFIKYEINGMLSKRLSLFWGSFARIPCWNFVHILGTPKNTVGDAAAKLSAKVSKLSAK